MYLLERDYKSWNENVTYFSWNYEHVPQLFFSEKKTNPKNKQRNSNNNKTTWK